MKATWDKIDFRRLLDAIECHLNGTQQELTTALGPIHQAQASYDSASWFYKKTHRRKMDGRIHQLGADEFEIWLLRGTRNRLRNLKTKVLSAMDCGASSVILDEGELSEFKG